MTKVDRVEKVNWAKAEQEFIVSDYWSIRKFLREHVGLAETKLTHGSVTRRVEGWLKKQAAYREKQAQKIRKKAEKEFEVDVEALLKSKKVAYELLGFQIEILKDLTASIRKLKKDYEKELKPETKIELLASINAFMEQSENIRKNINQFKLELGESTSISKLEHVTPVADILKDLDRAVEDSEVEDAMFDDPSK